MTDSDCSRIFALLSQYLDKELAPASCEELERHLQGCPECIQFVESLKRSAQLCRQFANCTPVTELSPEAMAALRAAYKNMLIRRRASHGG
jgi:RNA polymerase sigma-70 factor (ECF subfamily)